MNINATVEAEELYGVHKLTGIDILEDGAEIETETETEIPGRALTNQLNGKPLIICDVSKCGTGNPTDEICNEKVFRPTSDYNILRVNRDELKARLKPIKCNVFVDKTEMEFYKKHPYTGHPLSQEVEDDCNYILQEVYKKAAVEMAEFIIKSDFIDRETIETERGMEYRFRLTIWAEPKEK